MTTAQHTSIATATPTRCSPRSSAGSNAGDLDALLGLYERDAAFAVQPGSLAHAPGSRASLAGSIAMDGELDLRVTRVLEVDDLALVVGAWSFEGTDLGGAPVRLSADNADVLLRQADGTWRFVIDNPSGTA